MHQKWIWSALLLPLAFWDKPAPFDMFRAVLRNLSHVPKLRLLVIWTWLWFFPKPMAFHTLMPSLLNYERRGTCRGHSWVAFLRRRLRLLAVQVLKLVSGLEGLYKMLRCIAAMKMSIHTGDENQQWERPPTLEEPFPCLNTTDPGHVPYVTKLYFLGLLLWILPMPHEEVIDPQDLSSHQMRHLEVQAHVCFLLQQKLAYRSS